MLTKMLALTCGRFLGSQARKILWLMPRFAIIQNVTMSAYIFITGGPSRNGTPNSDSVSAILYPSSYTGPKDAQIQHFDLAKSFLMSQLLCVVVWRSRCADHLWSIWTCWRGKTNLWLALHVSMSLVLDVYCTASMQILSTDALCWPTWFWCYAVDSFPPFQ